jgi:hypothetical protein
MVNRREGGVLKIQSFRTEFPEGAEVITENKKHCQSQKECLLYEWEIYYKMFN